MRIGVAAGGIGTLGIGYTTLTGVGNNGLAVLGNVGIGTSSPANKLDVRTAAGTSAVMNLTSGSNATQTKFNIGQAASIDWDVGISASAGNFYIGGLGGSVAEAYRITRTGTAIDYHSWLTAGTERMRIDSSGNVGIGTNSPSYKLDITANTDAIGVNIRGRSADGIVVQRFADNANTETAAIDIRPSETMLLSTGSGRTSRLSLSSSGVIVPTPVGLGYGTGSGGTVTQATSKSTAVTLNKPTGQITMNNAALLSATSVEFTVNNSLLSSKDCINLSGIWGFSDNYRIELKGVFGGGFAVRVTNITAGSLSEALVLNFALIKGATS